MMQLEDVQMIGYECERIAIEKIKHFISKEAIKY